MFSVYWVYNPLSRLLCNNYTKTIIPFNSYNNNNDSNNSEWYTLIQNWYDTLDSLLCVFASGAEF